MTWGIFANAIKESGLESGTPAQILIALFKNAGYIPRTEDGISQSTAKKWIDGTRNCKASHYFPDNKLTNPEEAYKFFRRRPDNMVKNLQQIFRTEKDDDSPIDCETKDMDRFCWSLVNQFLDLLGFQRLELPASDIRQENIGGIVEDEINRNVDNGQDPASSSKELGRPLKDVSLKNGPHLSKDSKENDVISNITTDSDYHEKSEQASLGETPTEQMRGIFEKAVMDYNIAVYICKLSDYLSGEPFYGSDIFAFNDVIENKILSRFLCEQNENIYKMISEFKNALKNYSGFLGMIRSSISEVYGFAWIMGASYDEIIGLIDSDCNEIQDNLGEKVSIKREDINESSVSSLEQKLIQLDFIRSILLSHKQISELFGEICPGKTMFVF